MFIRWSRHAKEKFAERAVKYGINYGDIEFEVKKQKVKLHEGKDKFRTIFRVGENILTAIKIEKKEFVCGFARKTRNNKRTEKS